MPEQPEPISNPSETSANPSQVQQTSSDPPLPPWLVRAELFVLVLLRMYIGIFICYAPWSHNVWDQNPIFRRFPYMQWLEAGAVHLPWLAADPHSAAMLTDGALRGLISGLGLLNLWIALRDAIHRNEG